MQEHLISTALLLRNRTICCAGKMYEHTKFLILILSFVGGYKLGVYENLPENILSGNFSDLDFPIAQLLSDDDHGTSEALKNIQNYVFPKHYEVIEPIGAVKGRRNITINDIENENFHTKLDQNVAESKHAIIDGGSTESGVHLSNLPQIANGNANLPNVLQLIDPLVLMAVLGFIIFIVNGVLSLVDKLHLSHLLGSPVSSGVPFYRFYRRQQEPTIPSLDVNQNFLRDLERIFRLAVEMYERKI